MDFEQTSDIVKIQKSAVKSGRFNTSADVKRLVWTRSAGHCELCGLDLTQDFRVGASMNWAEVAHILPASPKGPRGGPECDSALAQILTNDVSNLMLLCPNCHEKIDRDDEGYPEKDLSSLHEAYIERIRLAATAPDAGRAVALIVLSQHHATHNDISERELLTAMSAEGLVAFGPVVKHIFAAPGPRGRDNLYWQSIKDDVQFAIEKQLRLRGGSFGDIPALAIVGIADIPALMVLGQSLGDRFNRYLFSSSREHRLKWPDLKAEPPEFTITLPPPSNGPIALVLSISAEIPSRDIFKALPNARIATLTIKEPSYAMVRNRRVIHAFRDALQIQISQLEAQTLEEIHVFAAIPAAFAIEFGALLTTQHQHSYAVYDRDKTEENGFQRILNLGPTTDEK
ncbi:SAVED domain-containing protein [Pseudomonas asiatica]|uniref:SAVED domain-containing protein n=1 Tax=Pseudomonas asiatica TaxID=2219225 RepID=UPI00383B754A